MDKKFTEHLKRSVILGFIQMGAIFICMIYSWNYAGKFQDAIDYENNTVVNLSEISYALEKSETKEDKTEVGNRIYAKISKLKGNITDEEFTELNAKCAIAVQSGTKEDIDSAREYIESIRTSCLIESADRVSKAKGYELNTILLYVFILLASMILIYVNFSVMKHSNEKIKKEGILESCKDELTQIWNRRYIDIYLPSELKQHGSGYLLMCDMDHFKEVNDTLGHAMGDEVLQDFSLVLRETLRPSDRPCRFGGDEFIIYLPNVKSDTDITTIFDRIKRNFEEQIKDTDKSIVTLSCGAAAVNPNLSFEEAKEMADKALYYVKNNGRNGFHIIH